LNSFRLDRVQSSLWEPHEGAFGAEVLMPAKLSIAFFGMIVGGVAILIAVIAVYLATAQLQYRSMARLQDRTMQAQGPAQPTWIPYARLQPTP
jgi:hypothetical protein